MAGLHKGSSSEGRTAGQLGGSEGQERYERIAKAIAFMRHHYHERPDLETVARHVHLSKYHFQRQFTEWAGISPKRFLQFLTVEYAKAKMAETNSFLELTLDVGLSSPGRLHDLFVKLEAMSTGEYRAGGAGLKISYGVHETPFGTCLIATTARGICNLHFIDGDSEGLAEAFLQREWPLAKLALDLDRTGHLSRRIFQPLVDHLSAPIVHVKGTNFQIQVWRALLQVPRGGDDFLSKIGNRTRT